MSNITIGEKLCKWTKHGWVSIDEFSVMLKIDKIRPNVSYIRFFGELCVKTKKYGYMDIADFLEAIENGIDLDKC